MLPHHFVIALISPNGRLSQTGFAILAIALAFAHIWAYGQISLDGKGMVWNAYSIAIFAMLWMQFCILTRRMRDTGSSGAIFVPLLVVATAVFLVTIDPQLVWPNARHTMVGELVTNWGVRFLRSLYIALLIYGIKAGGMDGPNAYGPEFGDRKERVWENDRRRRGANDGLIVNRYGVTSVKGPAWGDRRRKKGFGRR